MGAPGKYIVIEGTDGTGKSTQVDMLAAKLSDLGIDSVSFHEPDGVKISRHIRDVIKNGKLERDPLTNVYLFSVSRRENWLQQGKQALESGKWVLSARDYTSTLAFQGYGQGIDLDTIRSVTLQATDERYIEPDHTIILDIDDEAERLRRIGQRGQLENPDTFESEPDEFQRKVLDGYRQIAKDRNLPIILANQTREKVHQDILDLIGLS